MIITKQERGFIKRLLLNFANGHIDKINIYGLGTFTVRSRKVAPNKFNKWKEPRDFNWLSFKASLPLRKAIN